MKKKISFLTERRTPPELSLIIFLTIAKFDDEWNKIKKKEGKLRIFKCYKGRMQLLTMLPDVIIY